jgi:hypothetical protein
VRTALVVITLAAIVRLILAALIPPPPDESYYWEWSRRLAAGYFDHPFAIAFLVRAGTAVFGVSAFGIRVGSVAAGWAASLCVVLLARRLTEGRDAAPLWAAIAVSCLPLAAAGLVLATPDAPLLFAVAAALLALDHAISADPGSTGAWRGWIAAGAALGFALDAKYNAVLIPLGVLVALVLDGSLRRHLATPAPYVAVLLAVALFCPVLLWNAEHDWASFQFQLLHGLGPPHGSPFDREAALLGGQAALVSPILFVLMGVAVVRALHGRPPRELVLGTVSATVFLFFCITALRRPAEANWQAPAYMPALALLATRAAGSRVWRRWVIAGCWLGAAMAAIICVQSVIPVLPLSAANDPTARGTGWSTLAARVASIADSLRSTSGSRVWLAGNRYQEASEIAFHLPDHPETLSFNFYSRPNQYDFWPSFTQRARIGDDVVLALEHRGTPADTLHPAVERLRAHFRSVTFAGTVVLRRGTEPRMWNDIWVLEGWRGTWPRARGRGPRPPRRPPGVLANRAPARDSSLHVGRSTLLASPVR